jgi:hypothetical protein
MIRNHLCQSTPFFQDGYDAAKQRKISTDAKILIALKFLAYGSSVNAFCDYFQLGESTAFLCILHLTLGVYNDKELQNKYLHSMSPGDAKCMWRQCKMSSMEFMVWLDHGTALMSVRTIAQLLTMGSSKVKRISLHLSWRMFEIISYMHGMLWLDVLEHSMTVMFGTTAGYTRHQLMVLFPEMTLTLTLVEKNSTTIGS